MGGSEDFFHDGVKNPLYTIVKEFFHYYYYNNSQVQTQPHSDTQPELGPSWREGKRLMDNVLSMNGRIIAKVFLDLTASTKPEVRSISKIGHQSVNQIINIYAETGLLKVLGRVGLPYYTTGRPVLIYGFPHATPEDTAQAQKRYGAVLIAKKDARTLRQGNLREAIALAKVYMDDRGLITIPNEVIIRGLLRENGLKIHVGYVITALGKEFRGAN